MDNTNTPRPFMTIREAAEYTGLSQKYLRSGCIAGRIPYVASGRVYMINMPLLLDMLKNLSMETAKEKQGK